MASDPNQTKTVLIAGSWLRTGILALSYLGLLVGGHFGGGWLIDNFSSGLDSALGAPEWGMIAAAAAVYSVLLAVPFIPGVEISLALLAAFGSQVAILVYFATIAGLTVSYLVGRLVPIGLLGSLFGILGLDRAASLIQRLKPLDAKQRLGVLLENAPKRILPYLLKHRYFAVGIALNLPGNAIIGGGGGIALLVGISGLFTFPRFIFAVAVAVLPVPLVVLLMDA